MTSMRLEDISRKRQVSSKYTPNSYRIFCEEISNNSVPEDAKYSNQAPPIYTNPLIVPAQAIEDRNMPHGGRSAHFLRENYHTLNEPVNKISTKKIGKAEESRWWEWNAAGEDRDPNWKNKKRSSSAARAENNAADNKNFIDPSSFQTTYQKEHGYLKNFQVKPNELQSEYNGAVQRHSMNPNTAVAVGIVPVTDISSYSKQGEPQRVFLDKMSFEHGYDARKNDNYPPRGKRQGGFVMEQVEPKPPVGLKARPNFNRGASVWDVMHPEYKHGEDKDNDLKQSNGGSRTSLSAAAGKPPVGQHMSREKRNNERRDPIGYYSDDKFGGSMGADLPNMAPGPNFNQNIKANTREAAYNPSWQQPGEPHHMSANQLLEDAMRYQRPILAAEDY